MSETTRALGSRPEIHLGSGPDARVERSVTRARRMSPASADRAMRAGRVPRMPRWLRQPRHGSRAWYCPFTLASGSDPRHESRVALLGRPRDDAVLEPAEQQRGRLARPIGGRQVVEHFAYRG